WALLGTLAGFRGPVLAALAPDGRTLASADGGGEVKLWDLPDPQAPRLSGALDHDLGDLLYGIGLSPDGKHLAVAGQNGITLWEAGAAGELPFVRARRITSECASVVRFSPDGRLLLWQNSGGRLRLWDLAAAQARVFPPDDGSASGAAFFPDGRRLVLVDRVDLSLQVWDLVAGAKVSGLGRLEFGGQGSFYLGRVSALTRDGHWLAVQTPGVSLWDMDTGQVLLTLPPEQSVPSQLAWSPDQSLLAVGSSDGGLVVWNLPTVRAQLARLGLDW